MTSIRHGVTRGQPRVSQIGTLHRNLSFDRRDAGTNRRSSHTVTTQVIFRSRVSRTTLPTMTVVAIASLKVSASLPKTTPSSTAIIGLI